VTATLGDFLTQAGQRITIAAQLHENLPANPHPAVITELDRLLTVMARYASDGLTPPGTKPARPALGALELTGAGAGTHAQPRCPQHPPSL